MGKKHSYFSCYMCDAPSVSREHVPPKRIFPPESHWRRDLITVPSCKKHNTDKSCDDEFFQCLLAFANNTEVHAYRMSAEVVAPKLWQKQHLIGTFMPNLRDFTPWEGRFRPDLARFGSSVRAIVRGLYYHEAKYAKKLMVAEMKMFWTLLRNDDGEPCPGTVALHDVVERTMPPEMAGANPEIFQYRFDSICDGQQQMCRLRFYGGVPLYVTWEMENAAPTDARW